MATPAMERRLIDPDALPPAPPVPHLPEMGNIVAFAKPRRRDGIGNDGFLTVVAGDRWHNALASSDRKTWQRAGLILASVLFHAGVIVLLMRAFQPAVGVELAAISVELVIEESTPDPATNAAASETTKEVESQPGEAKPQQAETQPEPEKTPPPEEAQSQPEEKPDAPVDQAKAEPTPEPALPAETSPDQSSTKPQQSAKADDAPGLQSPKLEDLPPPQPVARPEQPLVRESPPPVKEQHPAATLEVRPAPKREPPPKQARPDQAARNERLAARTTGSAESSRRGGRGAAPRADPNYYGRIAAHLARFKQYPPDARSNRSQGAATVTFSIDAGGRVTSVRLVRGTGVASLDREAQAVPRRASPFPAPPAGRPMSFTVPISFAIR